MTASIVPEDILALGWRYLDQLVALCSITQQQAAAVAEDDVPTWGALERERNALLGSLDRLQHGIRRLAQVCAAPSDATQSAWSRCLSEICRASEWLCTADQGVQSALKERSLAMEDALARLRRQQWSYVCYADAARLGLQRPSSAIETSAAGTAPETGTQ